MFSIGDRGVVGERDQRAFIAFCDGALRSRRRSTPVSASWYSIGTAIAGRPPAVEANAAPGSKLVHRHRVGHVGHLRSAAAHAQDLGAALGVHRRARRSARDRVGSAEHRVLELLDAAGRHRQRARHVLQAADRTVDVLDVAGDLLAHAVDTCGETSELVAGRDRDVGGVVAGGDAFHAALEARHRAAHEPVDEEQHQHADDDQRGERDLRDRALVLRGAGGEERNRHLDTDVAGNGRSAWRRQRDEASGNRADAGDGVDGMRSDRRSRRSVRVSRELLGDRRQGQAQ